MKLLIDNALSLALADGLRAAGFDAVHVAELGLARADDVEVMSHASADGRVLISADTDFGALLSASGACLPSVILLRRASQRHPDRQLGLLLMNLEALRPDLLAGAVVVIEDTRVRVRGLPVIGNEVE